MHCCQLVGRRIFDLGVANCLCEARSRFYCGPRAGIVEPDVPRARASHREAAEHDLIRVDVVVGAHRREGFEDISLTGPAVRIICAAVDFELNVVASEGVLLWREETDL